VQVCATMPQVSLEVPVKRGFTAFVNGIIGLSLAAAGATLSATIIQSRLVPRQIQWLGTAGTLLTICLFPICFSERQLLSGRRFRRILSVCLLLLCGVLFFIRLNYVVEFKANSQPVFYLIGLGLTDSAEKALVNCSTSTALDILNCAGPDQIPFLYGRSFSLLQDFYVCTYLMVLGLFTALISSLDLATREDEEAGPNQLKKVNATDRSDTEGQEKYAAR